MAKQIYTIPKQALSKALKDSDFNITCNQLHPESCNVKMVSQFSSTCQSLFKMYFIIHLAPLIIFKRKKIQQNPKKQFKRFITGIVKSLLFAGCQTLIVKRIVCWTTKYYKCTGNSTCAVIAGPCLLFEPQGRRIQIALLVFTKALQCMYNMLKRRKYDVRVENGQLFMMAVAASIMGYFYFDERKAFRPTYLSIIDYLIGEQV